MRAPATSRPARHSASKVKATAGYAPKPLPHDIRPATAASGTAGGGGPHGIEGAVETAAAAEHTLSSTAAATGHQVGQPTGDTIDLPEPLIDQDISNGRSELLAALNQRRKRIE